jgi:hypothetical protein
LGFHTPAAETEGALTDPWMVPVTAACITETRVRMTKMQARKRRDFLRTDNIL